ncbi:nucleotide-diphospho-sugar transferase [Geopyxis carbonaria]|nr:nucleotide-diphospho-sugar transferase [Geopyxis carbonaria]
MAGFTLPLDLHALAATIRAAPPATIVTALLGILLLNFTSLYLLITLAAHHPRPSTPSERTYRTITPSGTPTAPLPLPDAHAPDSTAELTISVIVPAYNERARLPAMLTEALEHLTTAHPDSWEILVVDDGSSDNTETRALEWAAEHPRATADRLRVVTLSKNRGKGGAVAHGMRHIRGAHAIFADADGASKFSDLAALLGELKRVETDGYGIAVGSRAHMVSSPSVVQRSFIRNLLMHSFHTLLHTVGVRAIRDTQCGFKLFTRSAARAVFRELRTEGWIFDIEILLLAQYKRVPVAEVPISWHEVEGTKMSLVRDSLRMAWDLGVVRGGYAVGVYKVGPGGPGRE